MAGLQISFNDLNVSDYAKITLRYRSNDGVQFYANGGTKKIKYVAKVDEYTDLDLLAALKEGSFTTLSSIETGRDGATPTVWIDSITFVKWSEINYDFSSADDIDMTVVSKQGDGKDIGMVADEKATDGFALKAVTGNNGGVKIAFNNLDISEYETITLRIRTESTAASPQINVNVNVDDTSNNLEWKKYDEYTEIELVAAMKNKNINTLSSILLYRNVPNTTIYVDSVTLVKKTA